MYRTDFVLLKENDMVNSVKHYISLLFIAEYVVSDTEMRVDVDTLGVLFSMKMYSHSQKVLS